MSGAPLGFSPPHLRFPGMSQAVLAGDLLVVSGQVGLNEAGSLVGEDDPAAQVEQCFANLHAVLAEAGLRITDVVKYTCYLTSADHYQALVAAKKTHFAGHAPASSTVIVDALVDPRMVIELEALAYKPREVRP